MSLHLRTRRVSLAVHLHHFIFISILPYLSSLSIIIRALALDVARSLESAMLTRPCRQLETGVCEDNPSESEADLVLLNGTLHLLMTSCSARNYEGICDPLEQLKTNFNHLPKAVSGDTLPAIAAQYAP